MFGLLDEVLGTLRPQRLDLDIFCKRGSHNFDELVDLLFGNRLLCQVLQHGALDLEHVAKRLDLDKHKHVCLERQFLQIFVAKDARVNFGIMQSLDCKLGLATDCLFLLRVKDFCNVVHNLIRDLLFETMDACIAKQLSKHVGQLHDRHEEHECKEELKCRAPIRDAAAEIFDLRAVHQLRPYSSVHRLLNLIHKE